MTVAWNRSSSGASSPDRPTDLVAQCSSAAPLSLRIVESSIIRLPSVVVTPRPAPRSAGHRGEDLLRDLGAGLPNVHRNARRFDLERHPGPPVQQTTRASLG